MTPQPGTDLMPVQMDTSATPDVEAFYAKAARLQVTWLDTMECGKSNIVNAPISVPVNSVTGSTNYSTNWSGWQISSGSTAGNHYVQAGWTVPTAYAPSVPYSGVNANGTYISSIWVGAGGGFNSNFSADRPLIQAGTVQAVNNTNLPGNYYFWYEVFAGNLNDRAQAQVPIYGIPVNPGDAVAAGVFWVPESNAAVLGVCDWTSKQCIDFNVFGAGEPSNTTEWIVEAPTESSNGLVYPLPQFSPDINFINGCWAATTTFSTAGIAGKPVALGPSTNAGITGSVVCQPISAGPSLTWIDMQLPPPYWSGYPIVAKPGGLSPGLSADGGSGSNFTVSYLAP